MPIPRIVIAAPASGQGKTTVTMGLMAALHKRRLRVQPYKVGPDYIDPAFHTAITGRSSVNLDGWLLTDEMIKKLVAAYSQDADISVIEGVMGLYDGYSDDPLVGSTAGIAKLLDAPVILVLQPRGMAASAAAWVKGLADFQQINISGVIINCPSSDNHYQTVKSAIEKHTGIKVLGMIPKTQEVELKSRHLGLVQSCETQELPEIIDKLAALVENHIDVEAVLELAGKAADITSEALFVEASKAEEVHIAVARDAAFNFYYHENLEMLKRLGAHLTFFSPLVDKALPEPCDGIYLGGGYPEVFAKELAANQCFKQDLKEKADKGLPIYAECGGFMYLNQSVQHKDGSTHEMAGIFDGHAVMTDRLQHFGYARVTAIVDNYMLKKGEQVKVHEFHKSLIEGRTKDCIKVEKDRRGILEEWTCGMQRENVFGMYPHVYFPSNPDMPRRFIDKCRAVKQK